MPSGSASDLSHRGRSAFLSVLMGKEDSYILDRGDQVILNLLSPEPPPAGTFEVMIISRISKTALHQMMSPFAITPRGKTVGLSTR